MEYNENTIEYITTQQTENVPNISCYIKINEEIDNLKDYETQISNIVKSNKMNLIYELDFTIDTYLSNNIICIKFIPDIMKVKRHNDEYIKTIKRIVTKIMCNIFSHSKCWIYVGQYDYGIEIKSL